MVAVAPPRVSGREYVKPLTVNWQVLAKGEVMASCLDCELKPVICFNGNGLCARHADNWVTVETRHAPLLSGPMPEDIRKLGARQQGVTSHKPRHY